MFINILITDTLALPSIRTEALVVKTRGATGTFRHFSKTYNTLDINNLVCNITWDHHLAIFTLISKEL